MESVRRPRTTQQFFQGDQRKNDQHTLFHQKERSISYLLTRLPQIFSHISKHSTSFKHTEAAIHPKLTSAPTFRLTFPRVHATSKQANDLSRASARFPSSPCVMHCTVYATSRSCFSFMVAENSLCRLLCAPFLPRMVPQKTSTSERGWLGWAEYVSMVLVRFSSYLQNKNGELVIGLPETGRELTLL